MKILNSTFVLVGLGLSGIQILEELVSRGIEPDSITVIDPNEFEPQNLKLAPESKRTTFDSYERNIVNNGLSKNGLPLDQIESKPKSLTYSWGASCLPPLRFELLNSKYSSKEFRAAYAKVTKSIDVQAAAVGEQEFKNFPITNEKLDLLRRKEIAEFWVDHSQGDILHTRLAVSSGGENGAESCTFKGLCFSACPSDAIWNPRSHLRKNPEILNGIKTINSTVTFIEESKNLVHTLSGISIRYENLILAAGPRKSVQIINRSFPNHRAALLSSPVVLFPFVLTDPASTTDFDSHFVLADLLVPYIDETGLKFMTQIYLPTSEIAGRLLAQTPKIIAELMKCLPGRNIDWLLRHVGVAMLFLPGVSDMISKIEVKKLIKEPYQHLQSILQKQGAVLFRYPSVYFLNHDSYHSGGIHDLKDGTLNTGVNSKIYSELLKKRIKVLDSCVLPSIPPGPHTLAAAALARLELQVE